MTVGRIRRAALAAVLASVLSATGAGVAEAKGRLWVGSTHATLERTSHLVGGTVRVDGDFWFRVGRRGEVRGHAVVAYEPAADVGRLNEAIGFARTIGSNIIGAFGPLAVVFQNDLARVYGVKATFDPLRRGRQGPIVGRLSKGTLTLGWADGDPKPIPVTFTLGRAGPELQETRISRNAIAVPDAWAGEAHVRGGGAVGTFTRSGSGEVSETRTAHWSAQRIPR